MTKKKLDRQDYRVLHNKKALVEAMQKSLGVVTQACKAVGVSRETFYRYYNKDKDFKRACDECSEIAIDFVESKLFKQIESNVPSSTMFYLKTKAKHRGYVEKQEIDHLSNGEPLSISLTLPAHGLQEKDSGDTGSDTKVGKQEESVSKAESASKRGKED